MFRREKKTEQQPDTYKPTRIDPRTGRIFAGLQNDPLPVGDARTLLWPPYTEKFVGRDAVHDTLVSELRGGHNIVLWGAVGSGRTTTIAHVAATVIKDFPGGIFWIQGQNRDAGENLDTLARALGNAAVPALADINQKIEVMREAVQGRLSRTLLIVEEIKDTHALRVLTDLKADLLVMATATAPMPVPHVTQIMLPPLVVKEGIAVLQSWSGQANEATADDVVLAELVELLDGSALYLMLAARYCVQGNKKFSELLPLLRDQENKRAALCELIYSGLSPVDQILLASCASFAGPDFLPNAPIAAAGIRDTGGIDRLCEAGLLIFNATSRRYALHPLLRAWLAAYLPDDAYPRLIHYYLPLILQNQNNFARIDQARMNLFPLLRWGMEAAQLSEAAASTLALKDYMLARGYWHEAVDLFNLGIGVSKAKANERTRGNVGKLDEARFDHELGVALTNELDYQRAALLFEQVVHLARDLKDSDLEASALYELGVIADDRREYDRAITLYNQSLVIDQRQKNHRGESATLYALGNVYISNKDYHQAQKFFEQGLTVDRLIAYRTGEATTLARLGETLIYLNRASEAEELFKRRLQILRELGDRTGQASALTQLGELAERLSHSDQALTYFEEGLDLRRSLSDRRGQAALLERIAHLHQLRENIQEATIAFGAALTLRREIGDKQGESDTLYSLARISREERQLEKAGDLYNSGILLKREIGDREGQVPGLYALAEIAYLSADYRRAQDIFGQSLTVSRQIGQRVWQARNLVMLGQINRINGDPVKARRLLQEALPILQAAGEIDEADNVQEMISDLED